MGAQEEHPDPTKEPWLIVLEEAHRFISEDRPPAAREERTLMELAIAEARRYGIGFLILDQAPLLLSKYVLKNCGTVIAHRFANRDTAERVWKMVSMETASEAESPFLKLSDALLSLPEGLAMTKPYAGPWKSGSDSLLDMTQGLVTMQEFEIHPRGNRPNSTLWSGSGENLSATYSFKDKKEIIDTSIGKCRTVAAQS
ncbi:MAG: ATP-binding protein [Nitrososphaerota archaeon]|nr:ATP-binding protein [Nitrososphaerota archaeon]